MADIVLNVEDAYHFKGYVVSAMAYASDDGTGSGGNPNEDIEYAEGLADGISGSEFDTRREAKEYAVDQAKDLITDPSIQRVSIEIDGSWWKSYEKPKKRKSRAKKANPAQQSLFGHRRR